MIYMSQRKRLKFGNKKEEQRLKQNRDKSTILEILTGIEIIKFENEIYHCKMTSFEDPNRFVEMTL